MSDGEEAKYLAVPIRADHRRAKQVQSKDYEFSHTFNISAVRAFAAALLLALIAFFAVASMARANVTPTLTSSFYLNGTNTGVTNPGSGTHYDYRQLTNIATGDDDDVKRLVLDYPAGLIGDPNAITSANRCGIDYTGVDATSGSPSYSGCPASSRIGSIDVVASSGLTCSDIGLSGSIYLLRNRPTADPEVPTHLGIHLSGTANIWLLFCAGLSVNMDMTAKITLRPTDQGLRIVIIDNITKTDPIIGGAIRIKSIDQRIFGMAPAPSTKPFLTLPTRCDTWATKVYTGAYNGSSNYDSDVDPVNAVNDTKVSSHSVTPSCASPPATAFGFAMTTTNQQAGRPVGVRATLTNTVVTTNTPQPAYSKTFQLQMPVGYKINPAIANRVGAVGCTESQFLRPAAGTPVTESAPTCPTATEVGTTAVTAPEITGSLVGRLYLGDPQAGDEAAGIYRLYVYAARGGVVAKFQGRAVVNPGNGQVTVTMDNTPVYTSGLPQFNYSTFILDFDTNSAGVGSPSSGPVSNPDDDQQMLINPQVCGNYAATATITPWTTPTQAATTFNPSFNITAGTNGSCSFNAFNPTFSATLYRNGSSKSQYETGVGKHPDLNLTVTRPDRTDNLRDMTFRLPPGFAGSATAASICSAGDAAAGTCNTTTPASKVGDVTVLTGSGAETATLTGTVHLTTPGSSDTAKLAIIVPAVVGPFDLGSVVIYSSLRLSGPTAFGLDSITTSMPQTIMGIPTLYRSVSLDLYGIISGKPFLQNPSQCSTLNFQATVVSNGDLSGNLPGSGSNDTVVRTDTDQSTTGCASQTFDPALSVTPTSTATDTATGLTVGVTVPQTTSGVTTGTIQRSTVKRVQLTFPPGMEINTAFAGAVTACTTADIDAGGSACAAASRIADVTVNTPLLASPVLGKVYLETPGATAATRYKLGMVLDMPGGKQIIHGSTQVNGSTDLPGNLGAKDSGTGLITADFNNLPDVPYSSMQLAFNSTTPMFVNPSTCALHTFNGTITPTNGSLSPASLTDDYTTSYNGSGGACNGDPWSGGNPTPTFAQTVSTAAALGHPNLGLTVTRADKEQDLRDMTFSLPVGLTGAATATTQTCTQVSADAATCGSTHPASILGTIAVGIGSGSSATVNGTLYNTVAPGTQPAKLTAIVPVNVGPFNLGSMSLPVNITMRADYGLDATAANLPQRYEGIRVHYRSLAMTINGTATQGTGGTGDDVPYLTNPSKCQLNTTTATLTSALSNTVTRTQSYTTTGCPINFGTTPTLTVSGVSTTTQTPTGMVVTATNAATNPTIKRIRLTFPAGMSLNPAVGNNGSNTTCSTALINAGGSGCPAASQQGTVTMQTPLLAGTFNGNVYLEDPGATAATRYKLAMIIALPGRNLIVRGVATVDGATDGASGATGSVDSGTGVVVADFDNIPDLSFSNMTMTLSGGNRALMITPSTCQANTINGLIEPNSGGTSVNTTSNFTTATNCTQAFAPTFSASLSSSAPAANADLTLNVTNGGSTVAQLRNVNFQLPTGLVANTNNVARCSQANAAAGTCVAGNAVGTVTAGMGHSGEQLSVSGTIYNVTPSAGEPARMQAIIPVLVGPYNLGKLTVPVTTSMRADYGINTATQLPLRYEGIDVRVRSLSMTINGIAGGNRFMQNPSKCGAATIGADMINASAVTVSGSQGINITGCPTNFGTAPTISVTPSTLQAADPVGLTIGVNSAATNPTIKRVRVAFPTGIEINPAFGNGLNACSTANVDAGTCTPADAIADVSLTTPLLSTNPVTGKLYLEEPGTTAGTRYRVALIADLPGRKLIVRGAVTIDGSTTIPTGGTGSIDSGTGQVVADFDNLPDLGYTNLTMAFNSGTRAMVVNPDTCTPATFNGTISPNSGGVDASPTAGYTPTGCSTAFNPSFTAAVSSTTANGHPNLTLNVARNDKEKSLRELIVHLPTGLVAQTTAVPTPCTQASAAAATCESTAPTSQVGTFSTTIGSGTETYNLVGGKLFLVDRNASEPARFQAIIPVVVGPFDLGKLTLPVSTSLRADYGIDATTTLPNRYEGIAVRLRTLSMIFNGTVNGNPFITNPSKCQSNTVSADMSAADLTGDTSSANNSSSYTTDGCNIDFGTSPTFSATPATTETQAPTGMNIAVTSAANNPTIKRIRVQFPAGMSLNPAVGNSGSNTVCSTALIDAGGSGCPAESNQGTVSLQTPLVAGTFTGELFLETPGATAATRFKIALVIHLPGRDMILRGVATVDGATDVTAGGGGSIDSGTGVVVADFDNIPDLGFSSMSMDLDGGQRAMLVNPDNCAAQTINGQITPNSGGSTVSANPNYTTTLDCSPPFTPTFSASLSTSAAGSNPDFQISVSNPGKSRQLRNLNLHLPTGLVADTVSTPRCSQAAAAAGTCAAATGVGTIATTIGNAGETLAMNGTVYNVVPNASEPARLQAVVPVNVGPYQLGNLSLPVTTALRGDYGIDTTTQIPLRYEGIAVRIRSLDLTINGTVAGNGFMINPSECQSTAVTADMISADSATVVGSQAITIDGCPKQYGTPPTFSVTPSTTETAKPVGLAFDIGSTITNPTTSSVTVTFPQGVELNPAAGNALVACSTNEINVNGGAACVATSANLGTVALDTPLLGSQQTGNIFLETPGTTAGTRYRIAMVVHLPGSDLIIRGAVAHNGSTTIPTGGTGSVDSGTGQLTTTFSGIPDLAFDNFHVAFSSGDRALFTNPRSCASAGYSADFTPHGGGTVANATDDYTTTSDCSDTFAPTFSGGVSTTVSAANPDLTLTVTRPEKDRGLRNFDVSLPTGLVAATTATTLCDQATAAAGNCLAAQAVGSVSTAIGTGGENLSLGGTIYNVTPNAGEPARLSATIPVQVGPFDLGKLTIPVATALRADLGVDASTQIPLRYEGIAVRIRTMTMVLNGTANGNDFMINPSKCQSNTVSAAMTSEGPSPDTANGSWNYTTTGCGDFSTPPTISVTPSTLAAGDPVGLTVGVLSNANNPTVKRVQLAMPAGMEVNPAFGANVTPCSTANIDAATCNPGDAIGNVTMTTHLLGTNPTGKVYLETPGTTASNRYRLALIIDLPGRKLIVRGAVSLNGSTTIPTGGTGSVDSGNGQVIADFDNIPDLGFTNLQIAFASGDRAMLVNPETCTAKTFQGTITPNSGGNAVSPTASYTPTGCVGQFNPAFTASVNNTQAAGHPDLTLNIVRPDHHEQLRTLKVGLPVGLVANTTATTQCSQVNAAAGNCAVSEEVGSFSTAIGSGAETASLTGGKIYNVVPNASEPARFQAVLPVQVGPFDLGKLTVPVTTALRADLGVDASTTLPLRYEGIAVRIRTMTMVLNGTANGNSFITNPSKCQSNSISGEMTSADATVNTDSSSYSTTGCAALAAAYDPSITASVNPTDAGTPTALTFGVNVPAESSTTTRVQMTLPAGMELSPGVANGLVACSTAQIDAGGGACQSTSANLGTVTLNTPLLPAPQTGFVFLETPGSTAATRYKLAIVVHLPGRDLVLHGGALVDGSSDLTGGLGSKDTGTGRVSADFPALPDLGFTSMTVAFNSVGNKLFVNPKTCGNHTVSSDLTPHAGASPVTRTATFTTANGTCANTTFAPTFSGSISPTTSGGNPDLTLNIANPNGTQELKSFAIKLPEGLVANTTGVPRCAQVDADAGNCAAGNMVGSVTTTIGSGSETYALPGTIYNVTPNSNQPARLQAVVPVQLPPFDLGKLSIPVPTTLNPDLTVTASATLPSRYEGIAVRVRAMNMVVLGQPNANKFMVAPSKCGTSAIGATMTSDASNTAVGSSNITVDGCPTNFVSSPALQVTPSTLVRSTPVNLDFKVTSSASNPTIGRVQVAMPVGMEINPGFGNSLTACSTDSINAGGDTCPSSSEVGTASLKTQLLDPANVYTGKVFLESPGITATTRYKLAMVVELPGADLIVRGKVLVDGSSTIPTGATGAVDTGTGQITADFDAVPDLGFTELTMSFNTPTPMLVNPNTCTSQTFNATITPHSGGSDATPSAAYTTTPVGCFDSFSPTFSASVSDNTVGAHPDLTLNVARPHDNHRPIRNFNLQLPVGLVAATTATTHCSQANAAAGNCTSQQRIGDFTTTIGNGATGLDLTGQIFNVEPNVNEPARLSAMVDVQVGPYNLGKLVIPITTSLRTDLGVNTYTQIPLRYEGIAVRIKTMQIVLYGYAENGNPFMSNPSKCQNNTITANMISDLAGTSNKTSSFTTVGCPRGFDVTPTLDVAVTPSETTVPTGLGVTIGSDPVNSTISRIQVALPPSMSINAAVGNGLATCSTTDINAGGAGCPLGSNQGTVEVTTPLLGAVQTGNVYLEDPGSTAATRYKLAVVVHLPGTDMIVRGKVLIDGSSTIPTGGTGATDSGTGQITTDFDSIPDLAFSEMKLNFNTGPRALLTNPDTCGTHTVNSVITPSSGGSDANVNDTFSTTYDGIGGSCPGTQPFAPTFSATASTYASSGNPDLTLTVDAGAKDQALREFNLSLPAGLVADTTATAHCTQVNAAAGNCAIGTKVGDVTTKLGTGSETYDLTGAIHNVDPNANEPARLQAIIPVVVGPYDLGKLSVPVPTSLRGADYGVDTTTTLPTRYEGILVRIKQMQMQLDGVVGGNNFMRNPSKCTTGTISAEMVSATSQTVVGSQPYTTTGCPLNFVSSPTIAVAASEDETAMPTGLELTIGSAASNPTISSVVTTMPDGMTLNPAVGNTVATCSPAAIDAGGSGCPAGSEIGDVELVSPLLTGTRTGKLYLEDPGTTAATRYKLAMIVDLPGTMMVVRGVTTVNGSSDLTNGMGATDTGTGRVVATFSNIPDLSFSQLKITFDTGPDALLTNAETCGAQTVQGDFTPHSGGLVATANGSYTTSYDGIGGACVLPASEPFSPTFSATVSTGQAAGNPDLTLNVGRADKNQQLHEFDLHLPTGLVANSVDTPRCAQATAALANCAAASRVGDVTTAIGTGSQTLSMTGGIYNVVPSGNEPARLSAALDVQVGPYDLGKLAIPVTTSLRSSDYGVDTETTLPARYEGVPVRIRSMQIELDGVADQGTGSTADDQPFMINPSKCATHTITADMESTLGATSSVSDTFDTDNCGAVPFNPSITASVTTSEYGQPTGVNIGINAPDYQSTLKRALVAMPVGMGLNPAIGNGLVTCSTAFIDAGGGACDPATEMGTVSLTTPLLSGAQTGKLYLEEPGVGPANRYRLGMVIDLPGSQLIRHGAVILDGNGSGSDVGTGQVTTDFDNVPDIGFSNLTVSLRTGNRAVLTNPESCGTHTVSADLTPNSGGAVATRTATFSTTYDGASGACPPSRPFTPTLDVQLLPNALTPLGDEDNAGQHPDVRMTIARPDKDEAIRQLKFFLPNGFTGSAAAAPTCLQVVADAGNCTDDTLVGTVSAEVGSGPETYAVTGKIFNTVSPSNRPAKLTSVIPVEVGPYDLGKIITPVDTTLDNNTFALTAETGNLPLIHEGIPVRIREIQIDLVGYADQDTLSTADDKPFMTNPHECGSHDVMADVTSAAPQTVTATDQITIDSGSCPVAFNPGPVLTVDNTNTTAGQPTRLDVTIDMGGTNDATVSTVSMPLPAGFKINPGAAQDVTACSAAQLDADTCPSTSKIGTTTLTTPLLNNPLTGDVYLETPGTTAADRYKLAVRLRGAVDITIRGVAVVDETTGDVTTVFDDLPDIPFSVFTINITGYDDGSGAVPLMVNPTDSCGTPSVVATLTPYGGGGNATPSDTVNVTGCPVSHGFTPTFDVGLSTTQAGASPTATFNITRPEGDQDLRDVSVALPPGFLGSAAAVPLCPVASASAGTCAAGSQIGTVQVHVGFGADLLTVNGQVYMTEGQAAGDMAGMAIRLPAVAGPYDLGLVNVLGRVILRSNTDFGLTTEFKNIPKAFKGVPVPVRDMSLVINGTVAGKKVLYNSSACSAMSFDGTMTSYDATNLTDGSAYTASGCAARSFQPTLHAHAIGGTTKVAPEWNLDLALPEGHSTMKSMTTKLPPVMTYNLAAVPVSKQCHQAEINAHACPETAQYGDVSVNTPLLPYAVTGKLFLADPAAGTQLPRLVINIGPPINMQLVGDNDLVNSGIVSTFNNIPDLIWTGMRLHFFGGAGGALRVTGSGACTVDAGSAGSHSGQTAGVQTTWDNLPPGTCGTYWEPPECATPEVSMSSKSMRAANGKKGQFKMNFGFSSNDCYTLSAFQVRIKGSKVNKKLMKKNASGTTDVGTIGGKSIQTRGKDGVRVLNLVGKDARSISLTFKKGAWAFPGKMTCAGKKGAALKKCNKKKIAVRFVFAKNGVSTAYTYYLPISKLK